EVSSLPLPNVATLPESSGENVRPAVGELDIARGTGAAASLDHVIPSGNLSKTDGSHIALRHNVQRLQASSDKFARQSPNLNCQAVFPVAKASDLTHPTKTPWKRSNNHLTQKP